MLGRHCVGATQGRRHWPHVAEHSERGRTTEGLAGLQCDLAQLRSVLLRGQGAGRLCPELAAPAPPHPCPPAGGGQAALFTGPRGPHPSPPTHGRERLPEGQWRLQGGPRGDPGTQTADSDGALPSLPAAHPYRPAGGSGPASLQWPVLGTNKDREQLPLGWSGHWARAPPIHTPADPAAALGCSHVWEEDGSPHGRGFGAGGPGAQESQAHHAWHSPREALGPPAQYSRGVQEVPGGQGGLVVRRVPGGQITLLAGGDQVLPERSLPPCALMGTPRSACLPHPGLVLVSTVDPKA